MSAWLEEPIPASLAFDEEPLNDEQLEELAQLEPEERRARFALTTEEAERRGTTVEELAEWAMRKLADSKLAVDIASERAEKWHAQVRAWHEDVVKAPLADARFFDGLLREYGIAERAAGRRTVKLPSGRVTSRGSADPVLTAVDEPAFLAWIDTQLAEQLAQLVLDVVIALVDVAPTPETAAATTAHAAQLVENANALVSRKVLLKAMRERFDVASSSAVVGFAFRLECEHTATERFAPQPDAIPPPSAACEECGQIREVVTAQVLYEEAYRPVDPETGETVPGLAAERPEPTFTVTPGA